MRRNLVRQAGFVLAACALLWPAGARAATGLTLSKTSGPPTTALTVSGTGFTPSALVDVYFDATDQALTVTDGSGAFGPVSIEVPASAVPGTHFVTAANRP